MMLRRPPILKLELSSLQVVRTSNLSSFSSLFIRKIDDRPTTAASLSANQAQVELTAFPAHVSLHHHCLVL